MSIPAFTSLAELLVDLIYVSVLVSDSLQGFADLLLVFFLGFLGLFTEFE